MKKIRFLILVGLLTLALLFTACGAPGGDPSVDPDNPDGPTEPDNPDTPDAPEAGMTAEAWVTMLAKEHFENYTLHLEGEMHVTQNGVLVATNEIGENVKVTADKILVEMMVTGAGSVDGAHTMLLEGDMAVSQKEQYAWLFLTMLEQASRFGYDANGDCYTLKEDVIIETVMEGITSSPDGGYAPFELPVKLEMRDAEVYVSAKGELVKFTCDYSQTMDMGEGGVTVTSGVTTWSFSDYGTTVIPEDAQ